MTAAVRLVVVAHSADLARGVVELATQMAPDVDLVAAGGTDDGGLGTSYEAIAAALADPPAGGVLVLYDLGSALLTAETALELLDDPGGVQIVDAPLVEGAVAAAVAAQGGADRAAVAAAARAAGGHPAAGAEATGDLDATAAAEPLRVDVLLTNPLGLHARPAAELSRSVAGLAATVRVGREGAAAVEVSHVLDVCRLALRGGQRLTVTATGPDAQAALDRVRQLVEDGFGERAETTVAQPVPNRPGPLPGAPGRAFGPLLRAGTISVPDDHPAGPLAAESARLDSAIDRAARSLAAGDAMAAMHAALIGDPALRAAARPALESGSSAAAAWWGAVRTTATEFAADDDELLAARAVDVTDAGAAVLAELGLPADRLPEQVAGAVLLTTDIGPGELAGFAERGGAGLVLTAGSPAAHAVIVARGLGLPVVLQAGDLLEGVADGTAVLLDGGSGEITVDPPDAAAVRARLAAAVIRTDEEDGPVLVDGRPVVLAANIGSLAEARAAVAFGAGSVGLLRTELLMLDRPELPDEDTQVAELTALLDVLDQRPVVVRVLDAGGDKPVRALSLDPRRNGFLGVRGLRLLLARPELLHTQLRAICRASLGHRVSVMAPMVTVPQEAVAFAAAVRTAVESLAAQRLPHQAPESVGVMVEVPAAALCAAELAEVVDFLSVGTNDLLSYTVAAERTEPGVADLLDQRAPALWRLLELLCADVAGRVPVAVCGELAADPELAARLVALGVGELSCAPAALPGLRRRLRAL